MTQKQTEPTGFIEPLDKLREPFAPHHISKLPKESRKQIDERKANSRVVVWNCPVCGGVHHKDAVHLDYVGHAALTDRLLDTDITWSWEPVAFGPDGLPAFDRNGGLWIKLTVMGVTRLGYGSADGKSGGDAVKEIIGDALRNAAMRFGAALDLWHKGDLHPDHDPETGEVTEKSADTRLRPAPRTKLEGPWTSITALETAARAFVSDLLGCGDKDMLEALLSSPDTQELKERLNQYRPGLLTGEGETPDYEPIFQIVNRLRRELPEASDLQAAE